MKKIILALACFLSLSAFSQIRSVVEAEAENGMNIHCLAEGTRIMLADGAEISIEEVVVGDELLVFDPDGHKIAINKVEKTHKVLHNELYKITLASGAEIVATGDHPLLSDSGWVSNNPVKTKAYERFANTQVELYTTDTFIYSLSDDLRVEVLPIISIEKMDEETTTYTLELDNMQVAFIANGFFVGQE